MYGRRRDADVDDALAGGDVRVVESDSPWAAPAGSVRTAAGAGYQVFTPFSRAWRQRDTPTPIPAPARISTVAGVRSDGIPPPGDPTAASLPTPSAAAAEAALDAFVDGPVDRYGADARPPRRRWHVAPVGVPALRTAPPAPGARPPRPAPRRPSPVPDRGGVARVLRRRAAPPARLGMGVVEHRDGRHPPRRPAPAPTSASRRGAPAGRDTRSSTPACANWSPRAGCTTVCGCSPPASS